MDYILAGSRNKTPPMRRGFVVAFNAALGYFIYRTDSRYCLILR